MADKQPKEISDKIRLQLELISSQVAEVLLQEIFQATDAKKMN